MSTLRDRGEGACAHKQLKKQLVGEQVWYACECGQKFRAEPWDGRVGVLAAQPAVMGEDMRAYHRGVADAADLVRLYRLPEAAANRNVNAETMNTFLDEIAKDIITHSDSTQAYAQIASEYHWPTIWHTANGERVECECGWRSKPVKAKDSNEPLRLLWQAHVRSEGRTAAAESREEQ